MRAATDITGFGLAGHGREMADGANVTLRLRLRDLPLIPGIDRLDVAKFRTRAVKSNREYTERVTRFEGSPDEFRRDFLYDPQTSGGLLICVPPDRVSALVERLTTDGVTAAVIGEVMPRDSEFALVVE